jgi:hypothetical protein
MKHIKDWLPDDRSWIVSSSEGLTNSIESSIIASFDDEKVC